MQSNPYSLIFANQNNTLVHLQKTTKFIMAQKPSIPKGTRFFTSGNDAQELYFLLTVPGCGKNGKANDLCQQQKYPLCNFSWWK